MFIEGRIQTRSWEAEGKKNYRTEVVVDTFQFGAQAPGTGAGTGGGAPQGSGSSARSSAASPMSEDDGVGMGGPVGGDSIQYPDDEINPEDIPF